MMRGPFGTTDLKKDVEIVGKGLKKASPKRIVKLLVVLIAILLMTNPKLIFFLPEETKAKLIAAMNALFGDINAVSSVVSINRLTLIQMVIMVIVMMLLHEIISAVLERVKPKTNRGSTIKKLLSSSFNYLTVIVGVLWGLTILGVNVSTVFASVGVLALIVGFGAESLIADLVTGLFMIFENEFNDGDIVDLNGFRGTITNIGIRTTAITDAGGNIKIVNNSDMKNIINLSDISSRAVCDFPIPYEVKISEAEAKLETVLAKLPKQYPEVFPKVPEYLGVQQLADSAVILRVAAEVAEENRFLAARLLNRNLKESMEEMGIKVPYNQLVIRQAQ